MSDAIQIQARKNPPSGWCMSVLQIAKCLSKHRQTLFSVWSEGFVAVSVTTASRARLNIVPACRLCLTPVFENKKWSILYIENASLLYIVLYVKERICVNMARGGYQKDLRAWPSLLGYIGTSSKQIRCERVSHKATAASSVRHRRMRRCADLRETADPMHPTLALRQHHWWRPLYYFSDSFPTFKYKINLHLNFLRTSGIFEHIGNIHVVVYLHIVNADSLRLHLTISGHTYFVFLS